MISKKVFGKSKEMSLRKRSIKILIALMMVVSTLTALTLITTNVSAAQLGPADLSISVVGDSKKFAKPGEWVSFNLRITNSNSNTDGWVNLTLSGGTIFPNTGENWQSTLEKETNIVVRYSQSTDVRLDVRVGSETFNKTSKMDHVERVVIIGEYYDKGDQTYEVAGTLYQTVDVQVQQKHEFDFDNEVNEIDPKKPNKARQVQFNFTINNTGNGEDTFTFKVQNAPGSPFIPTTNVKAYEAEDVQLTINNIPKDTEAGIHFVTIECSSENESIKDRQAGVNVQIDPTYNLDLSTNDPTTKDILPDDYVNYTFTLENKGNDEDEVKLTWGVVGSAPGWGVDVISPLSPHTIPRNGSSLLKLKVSAPENATYPLTVQSFINISSIHDPSVYQYINTIKTKLIQTVDIDIIPQQSQSTLNKTTFQASFPIEIYNEGNGEDKFEFKLIGSFPSGELWNYNFNPPSITLGPEGSPNDNGMVYLNVTGPEDARYGSFKMNISATSNKKPSIMDQEEITIQVDKTYNIDITRLASEKQPGYPGAEISIKIKGENTGNFKDTFSMDVDVPSNALEWITKFDPDVFIDLEPDEIENTTFTLNVDEDAPEGFYIFTISCFSTQDETKRDSFKLNISVSHQTYDIELYLGTSEVYPKPGGSESFNITITNKGNGEDSFGIKIPTVPSGWTMRPSTPNTQRLKQDDEETIEVTVTIPSNEMQTIQNITINVSSRGEPSVYKLEIITVKVDLIREVRFGQTNNRKDGEPGSFVLFDVIVKNLGTVEDSYDIEVGDWDEIVEFTLIDEMTIAPNNKKTTILNVTISDADVETLPKNTSLTVVATSHNSSEVTDEITYTIDITEVRDVRISATPSWQKGQPKDKLLYNISVENSGTGDDRFSLSILANPPYSGWARLKNFGKYTPTLAPKEITYVDVEVEIPAKQKPGEGEIFLMAESYKNPQKTDRLNFTFTITQVYKLQINAEPTTQEVDPGENATYQLRVKNTGTGLDNVTLEATKQADGDSVLAILFTEDYFSLSPGQTKTITMTVSAQKDPEEGKLTPEIEVKVTSEEDIADTKASDKVTITLEINPTVDIELQVDKIKKDVTPKLSGTTLEEVEYTVTVWNRGLDKDQFDMTETNDHGFLVEINPSTTSKIDSGESAMVTIKIKIDNKAPMSPVDHTTTITATSRENTDKFETIDLKTRVKQAYGVELQPVNSRIKTGDTLVGDNRIVTFHVEVENLGTGEDAIKLEIGGDYSSWASMNETSYLSLLSRQKRTISIAVKIPRETEEGDIPIILKAISRGDDTSYNDKVDAFDEVTLIAEVTPFYEISMSSTETLKTGEPGDTIDFTISVTNRGNSKDNAELRKKEYDPDWVWTISPARFQLSGTGDSAQGDEKDVTLSVEIPSDKHGKSGYYNISIFVYSEEAPQGQRLQNNDEPIVFTVKVDPIYDVDIILDSPTSQSEEREDPGRRIDYKITIKNRGNTRDTFTLSVSGSKSGWVNLQKSVFVIDPYKSQKFNFTVEIPTLDDVEASDIEADRYTITLKVSSENDPDKSDELEINPEVKSEYKINLEYDELNRDANNDAILDVDPNISPGYEKFSLTLTNDGNDLDTVSLSSRSSDWSIDFDGSATKSISLDLGVSRTVTVKIIPPDDAKNGETERITITAESKDKKTKSTFILKPTVKTAEIRFGELKVPKEATVGEKITITLTVKNEGDVDAEDVKIKFYDKNDAIHEETIDSLDAGKDTEISFQYEVKEGDHEIKAETADEWSGETPTKKESFSGKSEFLPENLMWILIIVIIVVVFIIGVVIASVTYSRSIPQDLREEIAMAKQAKRMGKSPEEIRDMRLKRMERGGGEKKRTGLMPEKEIAGPMKEEEPEKPQKGVSGKTVRIKCPKCDKIQTVPSAKRPIEFSCSTCGMKLVLKK